MIKQLMQAISILFFIVLLWILEFMGIIAACFCIDHIFLTELTDNFLWVIGLWISIKWTIAVMKTIHDLKIGEE